ncbi:MAG TPA: putative porin, partial [Acinetobacter radioresistens]|nr:putative porin [Acinetobacter radioresistens]
MKKLAIASALLSALAVTGTANAYQAEVGASASYVDPDNGDSGSAFGVNGTYYFNPVQTRNAPLAEAAFLDRA